MFKAAKHVEAPKRRNRNGIADGSVRDTEASAPIPTSAAGSTVNLLPYLRYSATGPSSVMTADVFGSAARQLESIRTGVDYLTCKTCTPFKLHIHVYSMYTCAASMFHTPAARHIFRLAEQFA